MMVPKNELILACSNAGAASRLQSFRESENRFHLRFRSGMCPGNIAPLTEVGRSSGQFFSRIWFLSFMVGAVMNNDILRFLEQRYGSHSRTQITKNQRM
jgi:hypothetical protein